MKAVALQVFFKPIFLQGYDLTIFLIMWQLHVTTFIVAGKKEGECFPLDGFTVLVLIASLILLCYRHSHKPSHRPFGAWPDI